MTSGEVRLWTVDVRAWLQRKTWGHAIAERIIDGESLQLPGEEDLRAVSLRAERQLWLNHWEGIGGAALGTLQGPLYGVLSSLSLFC